MAAPEHETFMLIGRTRLDQYHIEFLMVGDDANAAIRAAMRNSCRSRYGALSALNPSPIFSACALSIYTGTPLKRNQARRRKSLSFQSCTSSYPSRSTK